VARLPGGPNRLRATTASVCCPTTSRPSRIQARRVSSSRRPVASATAVVRPFGSPRPAGSSRTRSTSDRRARAARRWSRSATFEDRSVRPRRPGRSRSRRSTERLVSRAPAIARPSSSVSGVTTTSHSSRTPRATASTGSNVRARSTQATTEPVAWASATVRSASVVRPLEPSPRSATPAFRGRPPGPRIASSSAKPVETTRSSGARAGFVAGASAGFVAVAGASARAPSVSRRGAAAPQRASRLARAADTSAGRLDTPSVSNKCSTSSTGLRGPLSRDRPDRHHLSASHTRTRTGTRARISCCAVAVGLITTAEPVPAFLARWQNRETCSRDATTEANRPPRPAYESPGASAPRCRGDREAPRPTSALHGPPQPPPEPPSNASSRSASSMLAATHTRHSPPSARRTR
jgi:hypothetical protein